jgi:alanine dehydrogenase
MPEDLAELREGRILWGWPHCVQQQAITQTAIDRRLTLLAFEAMFAWNQDVRGMHLFYRNNEMAGYCGVLHALGLTGIDGAYGPPLRAVVLSFGSVSRGGIAALRARGIEQITVFTQRPPYLVQEQILGCRYGQMMRDGDTAAVIDERGVKRPMIDVLAEADVIVNGILQDTDRPLMFFGEGEHRRLKNGALIVDVSCDLKMGFPFARPTSFEAPMFTVDQVSYTAVDHTPTYAWRSASWEISRVIVPYLEKVLSGPDAWQADEVLRRAVEMREGKILNDKILTFQKRDREYPHVSHA